MTRESYHTPRMAVPVGPTPRNRVDPDHVPPTSAPTIIDNGGFPKTQPARRKRTRSRWRRKARSG
jgi:hypothetical protein